MPAACSDRATVRVVRRCSIPILRMVGLSSTRMASTLGFPFRVAMNLGKLYSPNFSSGRGGPSLAGVHGEMPTICAVLFKIAPYGTWY